MKVSFVISILLVAWIIAYGSPFTTDKPELDHYYRSPEPILPMKFGHLDHTSVGCIDCHHNYVDDTGGDPCMLCHVTNAEVWPLFESQFHELCRGCHTTLATQSEASGPPRQCIGCHVTDTMP